MKLSNKVYDGLKFYLTRIYAPLITLIAGFGMLYDFDTKLIVGTISLISTFLGAIMGISIKNYNKDVKGE